jgi:hypothetical protein
MPQKISPAQKKQKTNHEPKVAASDTTVDRDPIENLIQKMYTNKEYYSPKEWNCVMDELVALLRKGRYVRNQTNIERSWSFEMSSRRVMT